MEEIIRLIKIDFDCSENYNSEVESCVGIFSASDHLTAHGKISKYFQEMPPEKRYLGWDGKVYPQYRLEKNYLR